MYVEFDNLFIIDKLSNTSVLQELDPQLVDVTLEKMANPMNKMDIIKSKIMINLRKRKNNGTPGPRNENLFGYMLHVV